MKTIEEAIASLPTTSKAIASRLASLGIKGICKETSRCPMSNFFQEAIHETCFVSTVDAYFVSIGRNIPLPSAVSDFIRDFDNHLYPELEQK